MPTLHPTLAEFRANSAESDPAKVKAMLGEANVGLSALKAQSSLNSKSKDLSYQYGQ